MEQQTAQRVYAELNAVKESLEKIQRDINHLTMLVSGEHKPSGHSWLALAGVGAEVWRSIDVDAYVNEERDSWN